MIQCGWLTSLAVDASREARLWSESCACARKRGNWASRVDRPGGHIVCGVLAQFIILYLYYFGLGLDGAGCPAVGKVEVTAHC